MFEGHDLIISELLAVHRVVDEAGIEAGRQRQTLRGGSLASALIELGLVAPSALFKVLADHLGGIALADAPSVLPDELAGHLKADLVHRFGVVPLASYETVLVVAAIDPLRRDLTDELAFILGRPVSVAVMDPSQVETLIRKTYGVNPGKGSDVTDEKKGDDAAEQSLSAADIEQLAGQGAVVEFVDRVLEEAIHKKASDIHFEPFEREFKLRYRVDGTLLEMPSPAKALALPVISRLKIMAQLNITERRRPQDGRIRLKRADRAVDLRVSTLPTQFGESVVLRLLDQSATQLDLAQLGLPEPIRRHLEEVISRPNGIVIVTGPTGSGKTTSLYSCLKTLNSVESKLLTIEDPVEYEIDGIMQVPVNPAVGLTFARALRTFLRQDPDVVMVGEIRDVETAQIAIQASLTGHLVLTTLHTNDAPSAVTRLLDMGIEPFLLASTLAGVLAQRLLRRTCRACRQEVVPNPAHLKSLGLGVAETNCTFHAGMGCEVCHQTGYHGRIGIFEYLAVSDALREMVAQGSSLVELRHHAVAEGMTSLRSAGIAALLAGETTVEELQRYL